MKYGSWLQLRCVLVCLFSVSFSTAELRYKCFYYNGMFFRALGLRFFCGTFAILMEITLQLRFAFVCHCDVFFITSQLCYLFVRCSYVS